MNGYYFHHGVITTVNSTKSPWKPCFYFTLNLNYIPLAWKKCHSKSNDSSYHPSKKRTHTHTQWAFHAPTTTVTNNVFFAQMLVPRPVVLPATRFHRRTGEKTPFWALDKKGRSSKLTTKDPILGGEWLHFFEPGGDYI